MVNEVFRSGFTRGARGLIPLFAVVGTYVALQVLAAIVYIISTTNLQQ